MMHFMCQQHFLVIWFQTVDFEETTVQFHTATLQIQQVQMVVGLLLNIYGNLDVCKFIFKYGHMTT